MLNGSACTIELYYRKRIYILAQLLTNSWWWRIVESFRFEDEDDYEYEIFSVLSSARAWAIVILAGNRGSRSHSTSGLNENVVVAGTSYQTVRSFIVLLSGEGLACYSINTERTEKEKIRTRARTLS